jgi:MurNAc alpha-1-phosphate uridylyltransferase
MKINTALILCAGFGKRLNPLTLDIPKPLIKLEDITILEICINLIESLGIKKIIINSFYLKSQIYNFLENKNFKSDITIVDDGEEILDTGGGILNMLNHTNEENVLIFNPDTIWKKKYLEEIIEMEKLYFSKKIMNMLLLVNKKLSFDKNLTGDFELKNDFISKTKDKKYIYTGCQILNKNVFVNYKVKNFSIVQVWNSLIEKNELCGFESINDFYHLTDFQTFKKLQDL